MDTSILKKATVDDTEPTPTWMTFAITSISHFLFLSH